MSPRLRLGLAAGGLAVAFGVASIPVIQGTDPTLVSTAPAVGWDIASRMWPPDVPYLLELLGPLWDTFAMATLGTLLAIGLALPVAVLSARNVTPSRVLARPAATLTIVGSRSVNSLVWALLVVAIVGPGTLAGVLAIALRSVGFVAKLTAEAIEEIDERPVEALTATGSAAPVVWRWAIGPQVLPSLIATTLFRWEINIRESTVLGFVGAGGIGLQLNAAMQALQWERVSLVLLVILVTVLGSEALASGLRARIIGDR
ncbi:MAG: phosphonate ABC transporter, permease protein PhnE [Myxococcota bacterium]